MKRILVRAGKQPFSSHSVIECLDRGHNLSNVGNLLFQFAFIRHVYRPDHYKIDTIRDPGPELIDRINESYEAFYVPLANAFRPSFAGSLVRLTNLVSRLKIPVVVVGVGMQAVQDPMKELQPLNSLVREFCAAVLDRSQSIGVRGQFTAEYL